MRTNRGRTFLFICLGLLIVYGLWFFIVRGDDVVTNNQVANQSNNIKPQANLQLTRTVGDDLAALADQAKHLPNLNEEDGPNDVEIDFIYELMMDLPTDHPEKLPVYILNPEPSNDRAIALAHILGIQSDKVNPKGPNDVVTNSLERLEGSGILSVNRESGYWTFMSVYLPASSDRPAESRDDAVVVATKYLKDKGIYPLRSGVPQTYRRIDRSEWFVEWHMPGEPIPVVNHTGLLSVDFDNPDSKESLPETKNIFETSDGMDNVLRPNDFNTITVAVRESGQVSFVEYNMHQIARTVEGVEVISAEEAFGRLNEGDGTLGMVVPSDLNTPRSFEEVFPDGIAKSNQARVRKVMLAYLDKGQGLPQQYLSPVYAFRGDAKLDSGELVDFSIVVSALKDKQLTF